jgi:hypothetical protein
MNESEMIKAVVDAIKQNNEDRSDPTPALLALKRQVANSIIKYDGYIPYLTIDGKRQVISMKDDPNGYDLWSPKRKPIVSKRIVDNMTCSNFSVSFDIAVAFLEGAPMRVINEMVKQMSNRPYAGDRRKAHALSFKLLKSVVGVI